MKKIMIAVVVFALAAGAVRGQALQDETRGFLFQVGLGAASMTYPEPLDSVLNAMENAGADRLTIYLDLGMGFALTPKTYLLFSISGVGDRLEQSGNYLQINTYLYGVGFRHYPFTTGIVLGADLGAARGVAQGSGGGSSTSDWGNGLRLFLGYDFARRLRGFTGILGLAATGSTIEDDNYTSVQIFFSLAWK